MITRSKKLFKVKLSGPGYMGYAMIVFTLICCMPSSESSSFEWDDAAQEESTATGESVAFLDIHRNIILPNCALPACHDGNFEPDFRTPQSFYYTTVYHPVIKNSVDSLFEFRVVPHDTAASLLIERITNCCFVDENDRMPVLMEPLREGQIDSIGAWISNGCPDWAHEFPWKQASHLFN